MTRGPFAGEIEARDGVAIERATNDIAQALCEGALRDKLPEPAEDGASFLLFDGADDGAVRFEAELPPSIASAAAAHRADALDALARAASAVAALHEAQGAHGDLGLGPEAIRVAEDGRVTVLIPARVLPAGALLAARLRSGAPPAVLAFSAPETVTAYQAGAASDVYSLAAIAHEIVTGRPPLGQIDFGEARGGPFASLATVIERALAAKPGERPSANELAGALTQGARSARAAEQDAPGPYRGSSSRKAKAAPAQSPAEATARREQASSMSGILVLLLSVGGLFVFTGAIWLVTVTWGSLSGSGRFMLLLALTSGVLVGGSALGKRGYDGSGRALTVLGVELLWADAAYLLDVSDRANESGPWALVALVMTAIAFVVAGALDSVVFAMLATLHYVILATAFAVYVHTGEPTGPATYSLAVAAVASGIAFAGDRWRRESLGIPFAGLAALASVASALCGVALLGHAEHRAFGVAWPYGVAVLCAIAAMAPRWYGNLALVAAGAVLTIVPTAAALIRDESFVFLLAAVGIGFGVIAASFVVPRLGRDASTQGAWVLVGLASAVTGPSLLFLSKCWENDGLDTLASDKGIYLGLVMVVSAALVGASYAFSGRAKQKSVYRLMELAGLLQIFGTFTIQSIVHYKGAFYPVTVLIVGAACLAVGATTKRATLVLLASAALLLNLCIQYFAKLWDLFPGALLVLVFGLLVLAGGILYERRLKHLMTALRDWA